MPSAGVQRDRDREGHPDPAGAGYGVLGPHDVVDDPGLAADLGHDPAALHRHDRRDARDRDRTQEPAGPGDVAPAPPAQGEPQGQPHQRGADPDHDVEGPVEHASWRVDGHPAARCPVPMTFVSVLKPTSHESRPGIPIPPLMPSYVQRPQMYSVTWVWVSCTHSIAANLIGWSLAIARAAVSPTAELDRRRDAGDRERDQQSEPVMAVAPPAQHADGVDGGDQEAGDHVRGENHVRNLVGHRRVEDHLEGLHVGDLPARERVALRLVHPRVDGDHRERAPEPRERDRARRSRSAPIRTGASSRRCRWR